MRRRAACALLRTGQRLAQLVRQGARQLAQRGDPAEVRQLAPVRVGFELGPPSIGDVANHAEDLVAVTGDDDGFEEALATVDVEGVLDLFRLVGGDGPREGPGQ